MKILLTWFRASVFHMRGKQRGNEQEECELLAGGLGSPQPSTLGPKERPCQGP